MASSDFYFMKENISNNASRRTMNIKNSNMIAMLWMLAFLINNSSIYNAVKSVCIVGFNKKNCLKSNYFQKNLSSNKADIVKQKQALRNVRLIPCSEVLYERANKFYLHALAS